MSSMPARRRARTCRSISVSPPTLTRHLGDSPAVPFSLEPLPAARMIPRMFSTPECWRGPGNPRVRPDRGLQSAGGLEPASPRQLFNLREVLGTVALADRENEEQREVEHAASRCLTCDSQKRAG